MEKTDRDVRHLYVHTLLDLCETKPLNKITVSDVVAAAGTARQTFYNNFRDINDLVVYVVVAHFEQNYELYFSREGMRKVYADYMEHKAFFRQLPTHTGQNCFRDAYISWLQASYYDLTLKDVSAEERDRRKALVDAFLYGSTDLFLDWCASDMKSPSTEALINVLFTMKPDFVPKEPSCPMHIEAVP